MLHMCHCYIPCFFWRLVRFTLCYVSVICVSEHITVLFEYVLCLCLVDHSVHPAMFLCLKQVQVHYNDTVDTCRRGCVDNTIHKTHTERFTAHTCRIWMSHSVRPAGGGEGQPCSMITTPRATLRVHRRPRSTRTPVTQTCWQHASTIIKSLLMSHNGWLMTAFPFVDVAILCWITPHTIQFWQIDNVGHDSTVQPGTPYPHIPVCSGWTTCPPRQHTSHICARDSVVRPRGFLHMCGYHTPGVICCCVFWCGLI